MRFRRAFATARARSFRQTRRAEASLAEIARWTIKNFGLRQAELYEAELLLRCEGILSGQAHSRSAQFSWTRQTTCGL